MPQAPPEHRERWQSGVGRAIGLLISRGYTFGPPGKIVSPESGVRDEEEDSALWYLTEGWGFSTDAEASV